MNLERTEGEYGENELLEIRIIEGFVAQMRAERGMMDVPLFDSESFKEKYEEYRRIKLHQDKVEALENDIEYMAAEFESENGRWKSSEEMYAYFAAIEINKAKEKIRELRDEIKKQEAIIHIADKAVQEFKHPVITEKRSKRGRPVRSEYRDKIAKKFTQKWVASLMVALEVKGCGTQKGLEKMVSETSERNWRRWKNGDGVPTYATFENLLDSKVLAGKYAGEQLYNVPTIPTHSQMMIFLQFA
jgi:hypothetical protein